MTFQIDAIFKADVVDMTMEFALEFGLQGKARPRMDMVHGRVYMPGKYKVHVADLQWIIRQELFGKSQFFSTTARYVIEVQLLRKRRKPKNKKEAAIIDEILPMGSLVDGKPDWDNAAGTLSDAGEGLFYNNDSQVVFGVISRVYGAINGAAIKVVKLKPQGKENAIVERGEHPRVQSEGRRDGESICAPRSAHPW